ncbi:hypothetical protein HYH03_003430 [Edaphochlamys debaryana]|uniref:Nucleotide-diphospho-sugar transferase domain-containing protein n=1 Tax=Edaphochlamys debaryana TaxID=47281 RepID=A0A835Y9B4_9CHLO|nr:hypothetical protein HYH03_003430 [Edaphochlamys debaryana]|eukprot:KAG2498690.1 hypothetical protein HYH03_003430 [Edaphochlamys debaryana]
MCQDHAAAQRDKYWHEHGLVNPSRNLRDQVDWGFGYYPSTASDGTNETRSFVLMTIATPASIAAGVLSTLLESLSKQTAPHQTNPFGTGTQLSEHTIVATTSHDAQMGCAKEELQKYKHKCYELDHEFNQGLQDFAALGQSKEHAYTVAISRIKTLVDIVSLGYDVLYFDPHHIFFQNPLDYMYTKTKAHLVISPTPASQCKRLVQAPGAPLPDDHHKLDMIFMRSGPGTFRCLYNWVYYATHNNVELVDKPLDHHTFRTVFQDCISSLGSDIMSVEYLDPAAFPADCHTKCGCASEVPAAPGATGDCPKEVMEKWVGYLFSCAPNAQALHDEMVKYGDMYTRTGLVVGSQAQG